jgi:adenosylmethionine-8-amino-7-oxononanoate aminotransferase
MMGASRAQARGGRGEHVVGVNPAARGDLARATQNLGLAVERGDGPYAFDAAGRRYIDALSNRFCSQLGYSFGAEMEAAAEAATATTHRGSGSDAPAVFDFKRRIAELAPDDLNEVFLTSGAFESLEVAWLVARGYFDSLGQSRRRKIIVRDLAYHGVALGALGLNSTSPLASPFGPAPIETVAVSNTGASHGGVEPASTAALLVQIEATIEEAGPDQIAMMLLEPVQMGGGCLVPPPGYWAGVRALADRYGILMVADDSVTGYGRLGEWFGFERFGVVPDMATCGTGLTSSYAPLGAVVVRDRVGRALSRQHRALVRDTTGGGNPVTAAVALRCTQVIHDERLLDAVRANEPMLAGLLDGLRRLPIVDDVRGMGYFWAVELVRGDRTRRFSGAEREALLQEVLPARLREAGLIARIDGRGDPVVIIAPPLVCGRELLAEIVDLLARVLAAAGDDMELPSAG